MLITSIRVNPASELGDLQLPACSLPLLIFEPTVQVHKAMLDLLKIVAKQLTPEVLAGYLGTMLEATKDTRTRLQDRQEEFSRMQVANMGGGLDSIPGRHAW